MNQDDVNKALKRLYLVSELTESVCSQIAHEDEWENKLLIKETILKLMGQKDDGKVKNDEDLKIWNYSIMYQSVMHFQDICSWILMKPELCETYPPVFGHLFAQLCKLEYKYLEGITIAEQVAEVLLVWEEKIPDKDLEEMFGVFLIENLCLNKLKQIPRFRKILEAEGTDGLPSDEELMRYLSGAKNLPSA